MTDSEANSSPATCLHCGLPVPASRQNTGSFGDQYSEAKFCCSGCRFVYRMIHEHGLQSFYDIKERTAVAAARPARVEGSRFVHFDDPVFLENYVRETRQGLLQVEFYLPDMYCAACVWLLEKLPELLEGVHESRVDFGRLRIFVTYNREKTRLSLIARALDQFGYPPAPARQKGRDEAVSRAEKQHLLRMGVAGFCAGNIMLLAICLYQGLYTGIEQKFEEYFRWVSMLLALPVMLYSAVPFYRTAAGGLRMRRLHIDLPIVFSILLAFLLSVFNTFTGRPDVYFDSITALVFLLLAGRWFQRRGMQRAAAALENSGTFLPLMAEKKTPAGILETYSGALVPGDVLLVRAGKIVPVDGKVIEGVSTVNNAVLTGESMPVPAAPGSMIFAGATNLESDLTLQALACGGETRVGKLLENLEREAQRPAGVVELADRVGAWFVVALFMLAGVTALMWYPSGVFVAIDRVLALLVLACPCALGLATPVALSVALAQAARAGLLIKGSDTIERLSRIKEVYFDKTGTLTEGALEVVKYEIFDTAENRIWQALCGLEQVSSHPLAAALLHLAGEKEISSASQLVFESRTVLQGMGVEGRCSNGTLWRVGSWKWLGSGTGVVSAAVEEMLGEGLSPVVLMRDSAPVAVFGIGDRLRGDARETVEWFKSEGYLTGILSGDNESIVKSAGRGLGFRDKWVLGELSPEDKLNFICQRRERTQVAMVGDGINDAAALGAACVGIGVHGGAEVCLKSADVYATSPGIEPVRRLFAGAKRCMRVIYRNIGFSLVYNIAGATAAMAGYVNPLIAAVLMPLSSITVISSSLLSRTFGTDSGRTWK